MVPSVVQATQILEGTNVLPTESHLEPEREDRDSSQTLERTTPQEDGIAGIVLITTGCTEKPQRGSITAHIPVPVVNQVGHRILRKPFGTYFTVGSPGRSSLGLCATRGNETGPGTGSVNPIPKPTVVHRAQWVPFKEEIGSSSA